MHQNKEMQNCTKECLDCYQQCAATIDYCLGKGGKHADAAHVRLLADCAEICRTSADFMLRGSPFHHQTCRVCADICRKCADECRRFDDKEMKACADACERCAKSCEKMAAAPAR